MLVACFFIIVDFKYFYVTVFQRPNDFMSLLKVVKLIKVASPPLLIICVQPGADAVLRA